jgi:hypothetical protein
MATAYPGALDTSGSQLRTDISSTDDLDASGKEHDVMHVNVHGATIALETKIGTGASNAASATAGHVLTHSSGGATAWAATAADATKLPLAGGTLTGALTGTDATFTGTTTTYLAFNAQTGTTYTFVLADAGKMVTSSNGSAQTFTVPPNSSVAYPTGTQIIVQNIGSANCTLAQGSGVTIQSKDSNKEIDGQYAAATLIKTATDTWSLIGALT